MRTTLYAVGAFLFLSYPLVMLIAVARNIDDARERPAPAAIVFTSRSADQLLEHESGPRSRGVLRNTTLRKSGN